MNALPLALVLSMFSADSVAAPAGSVIVRDQCFGMDDDVQGAASGAFRKHKSSAAPPPSSLPRPAPPASPAPPALPSGAGSASHGALGAGLAMDMAAGAPAAVAEAMPQVQGSGLSMYSESEEEQSRVVSDDVGDEWSRDITAKLPTFDPQLDWGGSTYLSNDDSMSLASAQRLLWAVDRGAHFDTSQVRPHELLNYFSFDTDTVRKGRTFSVAMSAEHNEGDQLSVALAVKGAVPDAEPLDLTLVVDRSCSMSGEGRMDYTKRGLRQMADQLVDGDRVDVVLFDDQVCTPLENFVVGRDDPALLQRTIDRMQPTGSTDLDSGLRAGYDLITARSAQDRHHRNQRVMLITDAMLNTGNVNTDLVSDVGEAFDKHGIRLTGVGVGTDFNDEMLDKLTEKGKGAYLYLGSEAVVDRVFGIGFPSLVQTLAHDVRFQLKLPKTLAMERFYGEESSTDPEDIQPIHYYAGTSQLFLQDLAADPDLSVSDKVELVVHFRDAQTGEPDTEVFRSTVGEMLGADRHNVDKAQALMAWSDLLLAQAMGGSECGAPLQTYRDAAAAVGDDAEIGYVNGLVGGHCGVDMSAPPVSRVSYKVRVDSDIPIAEVAMQCDSWSGAEAMTASDTVARFDALPGQCTVSLQGNVAMTARVDVPETGGQVRCLVRGGRISCSS